jgi:hypothetical protein
MQQPPGQQAVVGPEQQTFGRPIEAAQGEESMVVGRKTVREAGQPLGGVVPLGQPAARLVHQQHAAGHDGQGAAIEGDGRVGPHGGGKPTDDDALYRDAAGGDPLLGGGAIGCPAGLEPLLQGHEDGGLHRGEPVAKA